MKIYEHQRAVAALFALLAATGCKETVDGKHLDTAGIALVMDVTAQSETRVKVEAHFLTGGDESNTFVDLSDDEVTIVAGNEKKVLEPSDKGVYKTSFEKGAGGTKYSLALARTGDKDDAPDNSGTLPEDFSVAIAAGDHSRQDALTVTWDPAGDADEVRIDVDGDCVFFTFEDGQADDGELVIPAKDFILGKDDDDEGTCEAKVTVTRTRFGETDAAFDGESKLRLHQVRSTTFTSTP